MPRWVITYLRVISQCTFFNSLLSLGTLIKAFVLYSIWIDLYFYWFNSPVNDGFYCLLVWTLPILMAKLSLGVYANVFSSAGSIHMVWTQGSRSNLLPGGWVRLFVRLAIINQAALASGRRPRHPIPILRQILAVHVTVPCAVIVASWRWPCWPFE